jgi:hypothetical protein
MGNRGKNGPAPINAPKIGRMTDGGSGMKNNIKSVNPVATGSSPTGKTGGNGKNTVSAVTGNQGRNGVNPDGTTPTVKHGKNRATTVDSPLASKGNTAKNAHGSTVAPKSGNAVVNKGIDSGTVIKSDDKSNVGGLKGIPGNKGGISSIGNKKAGIVGNSNTKDTVSTISQHDKNGGMIANTDTKLSHPHKGSALTANPNNSSNPKTGVKGSVARPPHDISGASHIEKTMHGNATSTPAYNIGGKGYVTGNGVKKDNSHTIKTSAENIKNHAKNTMTQGTASPVTAQKSAVATEKHTKSANNNRIITPVNTPKNFNGNIKKDDKRPLGDKRGGGHK